MSDEETIRVRVEYEREVGSFKDVLPLGEMAGSKKAFSSRCPKAIAAHIRAEAERLIERIVAPLEKDTTP